MMTADFSTTLVFADESHTQAFAERLAAVVREHAAGIAQQGLNVRLSGDLGAGKTALTRAFLRALGVTGRVRSPTFELLEQYDVLEGIVVNHFDFYRFTDPREFEHAGFREMFGASRITVCEWSDKAGPYLPDGDIAIELTVDGISRVAHIVALSAWGQTLAAKVCV